MIYLSIQPWVDWLGFIHQSHVNNSCTIPPTADPRARSLCMGYARMLKDKDNVVMSLVTR